MRLSSSSLFVVVDKGGGEKTGAGNASSRGRVWNGMFMKTEIGDSELSNVEHGESSNVAKKHWTPPAFLVVKEVSKSEFGPSGFFDGISFGS